MGWLICAFIPWLVLSIVTRGNAGLGMLPLCLFGGVVGGFAVPVFGMTGVTGLWLSFVVAVLVSVVLLAIRRFSLPAHAGMTSPEQQPARRTQEEPRTK